MAVTLETVSFWNMTPYHHLNKSCSLHHYAALRMESGGSFKNVAYFCHTTRCHPIRKQYSEENSVCEVIPHAQH
jgi:hypothetical protein